MVSSVRLRPLAGFLVLGPVVVMSAAFSVRLVGLEGVSPAVDEEAEVIRFHNGGAFKRRVDIFSSVAADDHYRRFLLDSGGG